MDIQNGMVMLQRALPNVPMGSPLHTDILNAVKSIGKHMGEAAQGPGGLHAQQMNQALRQQQQQAPQIAAMRAMQTGNQPPAMAGPPQPEAA